MSEGTSAVQTVEERGVAVTKTVEEDEDGVRIALEMRSKLEEPAVINVVDPTLESIERDRIEIDGEETPRKAESDAESEPPTFERELGSGESWTIVYRINNADAKRLDDEPRVRISEDDGIEALLDRSRSDMLRGFVSGERESLSAETTTETEGAVVERSQAATKTEATVGLSDADDDRTDSAERTPPADGVARELLAELQGRELDRETKAALRAELEPSRSRELRLKHLQQQVSDLAAYTDMLEVFIDEYGSLDETVAGIDSELKAIRNEQAELQSGIDAMESEIDRVDDRLDDLEEFKRSVASVFTELEETER